MHKDTYNNTNIPLAHRIRPETLEDFFGNEEIIGEGTLLRKSILNDNIGSIILWGPPGTGKTTLAFIISNLTRSNFLNISAVNSGVNELRKAFQNAEELRKISGQRTILFIDEIHRFNKSQQDAVLPYVEKGIVTLIGATTENPSFEVNSALISRCRVYRLLPLKDKHIKKIILKALKDSEKGYGKYKITLEPDALEHLINFSNADARVALNGLESAVMTKINENNEAYLNIETIKEILQKRFSLYDKNGEYHYDLISALHKSLRNSNPDASLYWLSRMLDGGEDPLYIARRLIRFASEDIGLADPNALLQAIAAKDTVHFVGLPEANVALAQAVVYLSVSPKSNALYTAINNVENDIKNTRNEPVPLHLRNPVTGLMKGFDYGKDYKYAHNYENNVTNMQCLPENLKNRKYYFPTENGFEKKIKLRIEYWKNILNKQAGLKT